MEFSQVLSNTSNFPAKLAQKSSSNDEESKYLTGYGKIQFSENIFNKIRGQSLQIYRGILLTDNYHGFGQYFSLNNPTSPNVLREGRIYCNNWNGYSTITVENQDVTCYFEGLFRNNIKFGPGVLTYGEDGDLQDVGYWRGEYISRLIAVVEGSTVPKLSNSPKGKSLLMENRKLISVELQDQPSSLAKDKLTKLGASQKVLENVEQMYNKNVRNRQSILFNKDQYDSKFFGERDCLIDVLVTEEEELELQRLDVIREEEIDILHDFPEHVGQCLWEELLDFVMKSVGEITSVDEYAKEILDHIIEDMVDERLNLTTEQRLILDLKRNYEQSLECTYYDRVPSRRTKKHPISHLVAWNNEPAAQELLKHCFEHRNSENYVKFNVPRLIAGDRSSFSKAGQKEISSIKFLKCCHKGKLDDVANFILNEEIDMHVVDARGNGGVVFASCGDQLEMIKLLTNFGLNLDCLNDEHLTPLNICLLRYLAIKYKVNNWENAFLINENTTTKPNKKDAHIDDYSYPHCSLGDILSRISLDTVSEGSSESKTEHNYWKKMGTDTHILNVVSLTDILEKLNIVRNSEDVKISSEYKVKTDVKDNYLFKDELFKPIKKKRDKPSKKNNKDKKGKKGSKKDSKSKAKKSNKSKKSSKSKTTKSVSKISCPDPDPEKIPPPIPQLDEETIQRNKVLDQVYATISILLHYGAETNYCEIPLNSLHLSIYGENYNLVQRMLNYGANPNTGTVEYDLTSIHILATLPFSQNNLELLQLLLEFSADPNLKTSNNHWLYEKQLILGNYVEDVEDLGKNAVHILAMRYDFELDTEDILEKMFKVLLEFQCDLSQFYLGHTVLSLAILRSNEKLLKLLAGTGNFDLDLLLGNKMGVALTIPILKRYSGIIDVEEATRMIDILIEFNANPLKSIGTTGNVMEFIQEEYKVIETVAVKDKGGKGSKSKKKGSKKSKKSSKKGKKGNKGSGEDEIIKYLLKITRNIVTKNIQIKIVLYLLKLLSKKNDFSSFTNGLVKFVSITEVVEIIQKLINIEMIAPCECMRDIIRDVLTYVEEQNAIDGETIKKKNKDITPKKTIDELLEDVSYEKLSKDGIKRILQAPEFYHDERIFNVCYQCCMHLEKDLIPCPDCGLVFFCSELCNKTNIKSKGPHKCNTLYYNSKKAEFSTGFLINIFDEALFQVNLGGNSYTCCITGRKHNEIMQMAKSREFWNRLEIEETISNMGNKKKTISNNMQEIKFTCQKSIGDECYSVVPKSEVKSKVFEALRNDYSTTLQSNVVLKDNIENQTGTMDKTVEQDVTTTGTSLINKHFKTKQSLLLSADGCSNSAILCKARGVTGPKDTVINKKIGKMTFEKELSSKIYNLSSNTISNSGDTSTNVVNTKRKNVSVQRKLNHRGNFISAQKNSNFNQARQERSRQMPSKYIKFLKVFSTLYPDFDLSALFIPYACYCDGQLYYRFLDKEPLFMQTYSQL